MVAEIWKLEMSASTESYRSIFYAESQTQQDDGSASVHTAQMN